MNMSFPDNLIQVIEVIILVLQFLSAIKEKTEQFKKLIKSTEGYYE